ncbi:hypothetical protein Pcinc_024539 [Petrolisthes cinctipes]|uniref:Uncharacterized protein n=1 Tax=Petrolisthes cinctipes TaxID=88211 RepID=A0AAE1FBV0_PETCI|nr:hypothetical protein Pcinc_024539 [Petrolisthes cinctipes]
MKQRVAAVSLFNFRPLKKKNITYLPLQLPSKTSSTFHSHSPQKHPLPSTPIALQSIPYLPLPLPSKTSPTFHSHSPQKNIPFLSLPLPSKKHPLPSTPTATPTLVILNSDNTL